MENSCFKVAVLFSVLWFGICQTKAQNLVPNPSFEEYSTCPTLQGQLQNAIDWVNPNHATPDYFNECNCAFSGPSVVNLCVPVNAIGYQEAKSGNAYTGLFTFSYHVPNVREYIQTKLKSALKKNSKYYVGFYCNLRDELCNLAANDIGAFFSKDPISRNDLFVIDTIPQLANNRIHPLTSKIDWMLVSDTIEAGGDEEYVTIGNFLQDSLTDTISVYLEVNGTPSVFWGYKQPYYLIDDVFVIPLDSLTDIKEPKPLQGKAYTANGQLVLELEESYKPIHLMLTTATGQTVWQQQEFFTQGQRAFSLPLLPGGLYFVEVQCGGGVLRQKVVVSQE